MQIQVKLLTMRVIIRAIFPVLIALSLGVGVSPVQAQSSNQAQTDMTTGAENVALSSLLEVLKNDAARFRLIEKLEASVTVAEDDTPTAVAPDDENISFGRRIALITQEVGQETVTTLSETWATLSSGKNVFSGLRGDDIGVLLNALPELFLVIFITVIAFLGMRALAKEYYAHLGRRAERAGFFRIVSLYFVSNAIDLLIVLLAWTLGNLAAILAVGEFGSIGIRQSMYLNAFLLVEVGKVAFRAALSPASSGLRMVPISDHAATTINRSLSLVIGVLGYGQLLVVPIVNRSASMAAGNGVSALLSVLVLLYLIYVVIRRRDEVANWLSLPAEIIPEHDMEFRAAATLSKMGWANGLMAGVAKLWHWIVLVYLGVMFVVVMTQPANVTLNALVASGKVLAALIVASLVSGWLSSAMVRGVSLPIDINQKLPLLQPRLNRFAPRDFGTLRLMILIIVMLFVLDVIGTVDLRDWLESQLGLQVTTAIISVSMILLVSFVLWLALTSFVDYRLNPEFGAVPTSREVTLLTLLRNAATIALVILTIMFCLSEIGLNIGPLLASAGVLGLAIGFGAQSMVKDIITGIFIQFENAINVGDVITVGGTTGTAEKLSVRSVSLRDAHGVFHIIPFSSVNMVSNYMREFSYSVCDMGIAYRENVEEAKLAMHDAFDMLMEDPEMAVFIIGSLEWFGINSFGDNAVILRTRIKTIPGKQWAVGRAYNGYLKTVFDERDIEIPFPQQTMWLGENKVGETQPFRVETSTRAAGASLGPVHEREIEEETAKPTDASSADRSKD